MSKRKTNNINNTLPEPPKGAAPILMSINLSSIEVPELKPARVKKQTDDWVTWGGKNNSFPQTLIDSVDKCPEHSAFVKLRQALIGGEGFSCSDDLKDTLKNVHNLLGIDKLKDEDEPQSANDFLNQIKVDLSILECFAVEVRYNKTRDKIVSIHYLPASQIVPCKTVNKRNQVEGYYYSADWSDINNNTPEYFPRFNPNKPEDGVQIFFYSENKLGNPYQPEISYQSALNYIEMGYHLSKYGLSSTINGFFAGGILETVANMTEDQRRKYKADVKDNFQGTDNGGSIMVVVSETPGQVKFTPLVTGDQTPYINALNDLMIDKVCTAHRGDPKLASIVKNGASLGGDGNNYTVTLQGYENLVIRPFKQAILSFMARVLEFNGVKEGYSLDITSLAVISTQMEDSMKADYLKPEVIAAEYGYTEKDLRPELVTPKQPVTPSQNTPTPDEQDEAA